MVIIIAVLCVVGLAFGQILFKLGAASIANSSSLFTIKTSIILVSAFVLYGVTTLVWIWVLQKVELGKIYPIMALAFVLVPIGSSLFFGERYQLQYFFGVILIMIGIFLAVKA